MKREDYNEFVNNFSSEDIAEDFLSLGMSVTDVEIPEEDLDVSMSSTNGSELLWFESIWFIVIMVCVAVIIILIPVILIAKNFLIDGDM